MKKSLIFLLVALLLLCFSACDETTATGEIGQETTEGTTPEANDTENNTEETTDHDKEPIIYECKHYFQKFITTSGGIFTLESTEKTTKIATCKEAGEKVGTCVYCNKEIVSTIPALGHETVIDKAIPPSCTQDGKTEGSHCSRCNEVFVEQEVVPAIGGEHIIVIDEAVEPTCTQTGLSEGKHCSRCGKIYVIQAVIPTKAHVMGDWIVDKEPTCTEEGKQHKACENCDYREEKITSVSHQYHVTEEKGKKTFCCNMCDRMIENVEDIIILFQKNEDGTYTVEVSGGYGIINCEWIALEYNPSSMFIGSKKTGTYSDITQFAFNISLYYSSDTLVPVYGNYNYFEIAAIDELGQISRYMFNLPNAELISSEHTILTT